MSKFVRSNNELKTKLLLDGQKFSGNVWWVKILSCSARVALYYINMIQNEMYIIDIKKQLQGK